MKLEQEYSVSEFVAVFNQTIEYAYGMTTVYGELFNFRVSKNKWVYFDLKDNLSKISFFGTVYNLPGPLEDGMMLKVKGTPRLHNRFGFSLVVTSIVPYGVGTINRVSKLLEEQLRKEGLFDVSRKRSLEYPPKRIGLIASTQSAAYADFNKILNSRWQGILIECFDVNVQGDSSPDQIIEAINYFSSQANPVDSIVIIRGGGSPEDLAVFNTESVTRAIASSRIPTLVAIGHETDTSLAELASDKRASTPSNAAELLVPDRAVVLERLNDTSNHLLAIISNKISSERNQLTSINSFILNRINAKLKQEKQAIDSYHKLILALNPRAILDRGYAIIRYNGKVLKPIDVVVNRDVDIEIKGAEFMARINKLHQTRNN